MFDPTFRIISGHLDDYPEWKQKIFTHRLVTTINEEYKKTKNYTPTANIPKFTTKKKKNFRLWDK